MKSFIVVLLLAVTFTARAVITLQDTFHLGDLDPGAAAGTTADTTTDGTQRQNLTIVNSPTYVTDVPADYPFVTTYAMDFSDSAYGYGDVVTNATDNFGISAWVKPRSFGGNECIAFNGDVNNNGWGLMLVSNTFVGSFGGVTLIGSAPAVTNQWTHVALVCAGGVATLYVNGVASGSVTNNPLPASGYWAIAGSPPSFASSGFFDGRIDEVAVFTFAPGAFTTNDLQYAPPAARVLTAANVAGNAVITWPTNQPFMQLQVSTDLTQTNWSNVAYTTNSNNQFTATVTPSATAGFYRLSKQPVLTGPLTVTISETWVNSGRTNVVPVDTSGATTYQLANQTVAYTFTANIINPLTGMADGISYYQWIIQYTGVNPYTDAGINGYTDPALVIVKNALIPTGSGETCTFSFFCEPWLETQSNDYVGVNFPVQVTTSALTLSAYLACQSPACGGGINAPGCNCSIPAALPTTEP